MTRSPAPPISTDDLHAYADGLLPPDRAAAVEAYLSAHPAAARQVDDYQAINAALHRAFDGVLDEPVPAAHIEAATRRPRLRPAMAAGIAGLLLGLAGGWQSHDFLSGHRPVADVLAAPAAAAYLVYAPEVRHPVEVSASESDHLAAWLSNRMGMSFRLPPLSDLGFNLVGGRLLVAGVAPAALLMYENAEGRRLVLYVRNDLAPDGGEPGMRYTREADTGVVYWTDGAVGFGLSGKFTEAELLPAAQALRASFSAS